MFGQKTLGQTLITIQTAPISSLIKVYTVLLVLSFVFAVHSTVSFVKHHLTTMSVCSTFRIRWANGFCIWRSRVIGILYNGKSKIQTKPCGCTDWPWPSFSFTLTRNHAAPKCGFQLKLKKINDRKFRTYSLAIHIRNGFHISILVLSC